jgi:hypothetical protein
VDVERKSLSNKQEFEAAAVQFELEKLRIQADKEVRMAAAQALGSMFAKAQMQIFGDPETMARMSSQFMRAASLGNAVDGLMSNLPPRGQELLEQLGSALGAKLQNGNGHGAAGDVSAPGEPSVASGATTAAAKIPDSVTAEGTGVTPPSNPGTAAGDSRGKKPRHG